MTAPHNGHKISYVRGLQTKTMSDPPDPTDPANDGPPTADGITTPNAPTSGRGDDYDVDGERESTESPLADVTAVLDALALDRDRYEAVRAMYEYLRNAGTARKSDFTEDVYPDHPAGFSSSGRWWNALGENVLGELPNVRKPREGRSQWQFTTSGE